MKVKFVIYILFILVFENYAFAQNEYVSADERANLIMEQLYPKGKEKLIILKKDYELADSLMVVADNYYSKLEEYRVDFVDTEAANRNKEPKANGETKKISKRRKSQKLYKKMVKVENKALKSRIKSLDSYHNVAVIRYQIYQNDLKKFMEKASSEQLDSAKKWEDLAFQSFDKADSKVYIAYHTVNHSDVFDIYTQAYVLEQIGLLYQNKVYALFLNWEQTDLSRINEEIVSMQLNRPLSNSQLENQLSEIKNTDSIIYEKVYVYDTVRVKQNRTELIYKIQIAASKTPLSISQLRKLYYADDIINTAVEGGWYKYSVGVFETYQEAKRFKLNIGVSDSFVVAYKKGVKIKVSEALSQDSD